MTTDTDLRAFRFSAMVPVHQQELALQVASLEDKLNEEINLADYTSAIRTIYFMPISAELPDAEAYNRYDAETGTVEIRVLVDAGEEILKVLVRELEAMNNQVGQSIIRAIQEITDTE